MSDPKTAPPDVNAYAEFFVSVANIKVLATEGNLEAAQTALTTLADPRVTDTFGHDQTASLALELGLVRLAEREIQLAIRDNRGAESEKAWLRALADLYRDVGDADKELRIREKIDVIDPSAGRARIEELVRKTSPKLGSPGKEDAGENDISAARPRKKARHAPPRHDEPVSVDHARDDEATTTTEPPRRQEPTEPAAGIAPPAYADVARFIRLFHGRGDVHARQWVGREGRHGYSPVERPITRERVLAHVGGDETLGVYQVREDRTVVFFAIDLDATKMALQRARSSRDEAVSLRRRLHREGMRIRALAASVGIPMILEDSGYKGRHLWGFLKDPLPIGLMRNFVRMLGRVVYPEDADLTIECFPKQDRLKDDQLGNLIKLPLGIHLRSGRRAFILDDDGRPAFDPWPILRDVELFDRERILDAMERMRARTGDLPADDGDPGAGGLGGARRGSHPVATPPPPSFHVADFEKDPELATILAGCEVLKALVERGLERRRLTHDEQTVVRHVLGHKPVGMHAVNYVFKRCPEIPPENMLKSMLSGFAMSCPKIRKKVPDVTSALHCNCEFRNRPDQYPNPLLHIDEAKARGMFPRAVTLKVSRSEEERIATIAPEAVQTWVAKFSNAQESVARAAREMLEAERALVSALRLMPNGAIELPEGRWRLEGEGDKARPVWESKG